MSGEPDPQRAMGPMKTETDDRQAMKEVELAMLATGLQRLVTRWRTLAIRIEPYAAPAARAYEQAAEDLEAEIRRHPERMEAIHALRDALLAAFRGTQEGDSPSVGIG